MMTLEKRNEQVFKFYTQKTKLMIAREEKDTATASHVWSDLLVRPPVLW